MSNYRHQQMIEKLFEHPLSVNIDVKKLFSALEHYGAKIEMTKHNKAKIYMGAREFVLALSHGHDLSRDALQYLRHFLEDIDLVPGKL